MKLNLAALTQVAQECQLEARPEEIELVPPRGYDARIDAPVTAILTAHRSGEEYFASGAASTRGRFTCVRCLKEFEAALECPISLVIHRVAAPLQTTTETETYVEIPLGTSEFDVGPYVRDGLLLAISSTPRCRDDCKGLCSHCGVDLNIESCSCQEAPADPRWNGLRQLNT